MTDGPDRLWQQYAESVPGVAVAQERLVDSALELFLHSLRPSGRSGALRLKR